MQKRRQGLQCAAWRKEAAGLPYGGLLFRPVNYTIREVQRGG